MEINLKNQKVFLMKFFSLPVNTLHGLGLPRSLSCPTAPVRDRTGQDRTGQDRTGQGEAWADPALSLYVTFFIIKNMNLVMP